VNGYLLDTNVALIAGVHPESLSRAVRRAIERGPCLLSVVSYWEVVLKSGKGKLDVGDPRSWWTDSLETLAATPLSVRADHIARICNLPRIHEDPFDRALIAQATVEDLALVTTDRQIPLYSSASFQVVQ
jgi:PIN domain nuclease of toxin-antitoxin system